MFIGVNSGTSREQIAGYARQIGIPWPIIADTSRTLEKRAGIPEISLQNIMQAAYISPDGQLHRGNWSDIPGTAERALSGARWQVDPSTIPADLKSAWQAVEFGKFSLAAKEITKALAVADPARKQAAESLFAIVKGELDKDAAAAWELGKQNDLYRAHLAMTRLQQRFEGYEIPEKITSAAAWLAKQDSVKKEEQAQEILANAKALANSPRETIQRRALTLLSNVVKRFPETAAAKEAQQLIDAAGAR